MNDPSIADLYIKRNDVLAKIAQLNDDKKDIDYTIREKYQDKEDEKRLEKGLKHGSVNIFDSSYMVKIDIPRTFKYDNEAMRNTVVKRFIVDKIEPGDYLRCKYDILEHKYLSLDPKYQELIDGCRIAQLGKPVIVITERKKGA